MSDERPQTELCPLCGHERAPQHMADCRDCGERYCKRCSALRHAQANAMWSESWHHIPARWEGRCKQCLGREMATPVTCASCSAPTPHTEIFWGGQCDKCGDYVCYECARAKQRAGGGWESPHGVWDFRCKRHVGFLARGWQTPDRPPNYEKR